MSLTPHKRSSKAEVEDLIRARYSLLSVISHEEARVEESLRKLCVEREMRLEVWSITEGFKVPKEMLGLVSSLVLRCDDCITYHVVRCHEEGTTREEFLEIFSVGLVVGGSIVIPHLRRAMARLEELAGPAA